MPQRRNRRAVLAAAAAVVLVFAAVWALLDLTEDRPGWIVVEAPAAASPGRPFEVRVRLSGPVGPGLLLNCTLHHADAERKGWGYLAAAGPARPAASNESRSFVFTFSERPDTSYVFAVAYLSPTGRWPNATRAVSTAYIPVVKSEPVAAAAGPRKIRLFRFPTEADEARAASRLERPRGRPSLWVHPAIGALLLAAAGLAAAAGVRQSSAGGPGDAAQRAAWLALAVVLLACAAVEISGITGHLAAWGRRLAEARGVYELRRPFQKSLTAAAAAASLGYVLLFIRAVRRPGRRRLLWWAGLGLTAFLAVSFAGALSLHSVDAVRIRVWHGVSAFDAARGAGAALAAAASGLAARRKADRRPT